MSGTVTFVDGQVLYASQLNTAFGQKADANNPTFTGGSLTLPSGSTGGRPATPAQYAVRGNTDNSVLEVYINGSWVSINPGSGTSPTGGGTSPGGGTGNAPSQVTGLAIGTTTPTVIPISWSAATGPGPITYQLNYRVSGSSTWTAWGGPTSATSATVSGLQPATSYDFEVIAANQYGTSTSPIVTGVTQAIAPSAPTNLILSQITMTGANLAWTPPSTGTTPFSYQPLYQVSGATSWTNFGSQISSPSVTYTGLSPSTTYLFEVIASNTAGTAASTSVSGTTLAAASVAPNAPTGLATSAVGQNGLTLGWVAPTTGTTPFTYTVQGWVNNTSTVYTLGTTTSTSLVINDLNPNTNYVFDVIAQNSAGSATSATVLGPTNPVVSGTTGQVWGTQYSAPISPFLQGPVAGQVTVGSALAVSGIAVTDVARNGNYSIGFSAGKGKVSSTDSSGSPVSGSGTSSISYTSTYAAISAVLANLIYTAPSAAATDTVSISVTDPNSVRFSLSTTITSVAAVQGPLPWGNSSLAGPGNIANDSSGTTAVRIQDVLGGFGVNTRVDYGTSTYYNNIAKIENSINYLGISRVRDTPGSANSGSPSSATTWYPQIAGAAKVIGGLKYNLYLGFETSSSYAGQLSIFQQLAASGYVFAFEGAEDPDSVSPSQLSNAISYQATLNTAAHNAGVSSIELSLGNSSNEQNIGNADYGNAQFYPVDAPYDSGLGGYLTGAQTVAPGKPVILGEYGWLSFAEGGSGSGQQGIGSVNAVAAYCLDCLFDAYMTGFKQYFWFELLDDANQANPNGGTGTTFGLFDTSFNPKPAATAIRNMMLLLGDQGSTNHTFSPGKLNVSYSVQSAGVGNLGMQYLVTQRSDGAFFIVMWNEQILQNLANYPNQTNAEVTVSAVSQTITLGTSATSIAVYDPMVGTTAVKTGSGTSIAVSVPAHPIFIEIVRP